YPKILRRVGGYNLDLFTPTSPFRREPRASADFPPALARGSRRNGFNLAHLLVGSEGTLAVTLEAKLRLIELPKARAVLVVPFTELLDALGATPAILKHVPSAVEVIDRYVLDSTRLNPEASRLRDFLHGDPGAILIVEFYAGRPDELPPRLDALEADLRARNFGQHLLRATDAAAQG